MTMPFIPAPVPGVILAVMAVWATGCGSRSPAGMETPGPPAASADAAPGLSDQRFYLGSDVSELKFGGDPKTVLAWSADRPFVTGAEFDAWLGTYPLRFAATEPVAMKKEALFQMVVFKLLVQKAREGGYEEKLRAQGRVPDPSTVALAFTRENITDLASVSEKEAHEYRVRYADRLKSIEVAAVPEEVKLLAVKGNITSERLKTKVERWISEAGIRYDDAVWSVAPEAAGRTPQGEVDENND